MAGAEQLNSFLVDMFGRINKIEERTMAGGLGSAISITEILYYAKAAVTRTGNVFPYVIAFVIYLAMNTVLQLFFNWLEKKMAY